MGCNSTGESIAILNERPALRVVTPEVGLGLTRVWQADV